MKKVVFLIVIILIVIQFFRPAKNVTSKDSENSIEKHYDVPQNIKSLLKVACYDCHSNNTNYYWYNNVQPVGWWLANHIREGKEHLNFDEFDTYSFQKKGKKIKEIIETVQEKEMPLWSYTIMHTDARLTKEQQQELVNWANKLYGSFDR